MPKQPATKKGQAMKGTQTERTAEHERLSTDGRAWKRWGPYLSERQWGTVREDYSEGGDAWNYFTHDHARARAYRWGEDGLASFSDEEQQICFGLALWNGKDPILKERLFGLTNSEGNHGEDVKEYYFYLDSTPTHSYMKYLYKYPQSAYPYDDLVRTNRQRSRETTEYELLDTGVFDDDRYFDVFVEYAKGGPEDILIQITAVNRGKKAAELHVLPSLWFRNTWAEWHAKPAPKPSLKQMSGPPGVSAVEAKHKLLGEYVLYCEGDVPLLFTDNDTNNERLFPQYPNASPYVKDGINNYVVHGQQGAVNPDRTGTKVSAHYRFTIKPGGTATAKLRLVQQAESSVGAARAKTTGGAKTSSPFGQAFDALLKERLGEADEFYRAVTPPSVGPDEANVMRQALAGMLWSKQFYFLDADQWLEEHYAHPLHSGSRQFRNRDWFHMVNRDIISMPDKWEYPWYAAWDLAFHTLPLSIVDPDFAKQQMKLMLHGYYLHPSGQIPAYEWNFSDVNPPVHAWATLFLHRTEQALKGEGDLDFIKAAFNKLLLNFTWWVNRKDRYGKNVFEGGFLGLDNIGVFDRSAPLPTGGHLEQADGTAWMALFTQNMLELAVEITPHDRTYADMVEKFLEHFLYIAAAMNGAGSEGMWDEEDGFYYDLLRTPDGRATRLKVRSMVGLLPICATTVVEDWQREKQHRGVSDRGILALVNEDRLRRILSKMLDENEFFGPFGIRSLSKFHLDHPFVFHVGGQVYRVDYLPAESNTGMFGGNSNWRGPVWMPVNAMIIRALLSYYLYYGDNFKIECPTGSGRMMNLFEVSKEISSRLTGIFLRDGKANRPVYGGTEKFQSDPHWRDNLQFYEYFHGDNGAGLGANHQTGWTGLVAKMIELFGRLDGQQCLQQGKRAAHAGGKTER